MQITLQKVCFLLLTLGLIIAGLVIAKDVIGPVIFAGLFTLALVPFCNKFESWGVNKTLSIIIVFLIIIVVLVLLLTLFSITFAHIYQELPEIRVKIDSGLNALEQYVNDLTGITDEKIQSEIQENKSRILSPLWKFIENSISASFLTIGNIFLTILYTFLLLYYRKGIYKIFVRKLDEDRKKKRTVLLKEIIEVIKAYTQSMLIVMVVLSTINSIGLWIIGIDYPVFWGVLAGILVIIPYIGTTLGGLLPFLYAMATTDTIWQPIAIVIMYFTVQQIEGNFITPNIVGNKVHVNALTVILAMILGGLIWGLSGLILALPVVAVLRTILVQFEDTKNLGLLMSGDLGNK